jgi:hypothetical protein
MNVDQNEAGMIHGLIVYHFIIRQQLNKKGSSDTAASFFSNQQMTNLKQAADV